MVFHRTGTSLPRCSSLCRPGITTAKARRFTLERKAGESRLPWSFRPYCRHLWSSSGTRPRLEHRLEQSHHYCGALHYATLCSLCPGRKIRCEASLRAWPHYPGQITGCMLFVQLLRVRWLVGSHLLHTFVLAGDIWLWCITGRALAGSVYPLRRQWLAVWWYLHEADCEVLLDHRYCLFELDHWSLDHPPFRWHAHEKSSCHSYWDMYLRLLQWHWSNDYPHRSQ